MTRQKSSRTTHAASGTAQQQQKASRDPDEKENGGNGELSEEDLKRLWRQKYKFRVKKLGVSPRKAREWTDHTIQLIRGSHA
jgi:hypothetical protein